MSHPRSHTSRHHWRPRSRGGKDSQVVILPEAVHRAYHELFGNLTMEEAELFLMNLHILFQGVARIDREMLETLMFHCRR